MGYDRGDSFLFDFELNGIPFGAKSKGKLSPRSYPIQFEWKWNTSFLSVEEINFGIFFGGFFWEKKVNIFFFSVYQKNSQIYLI